MKINVRFVDEEEQLITASEQVAFSKAKKLPYLIFKRIIDTVLALAMIIVLSPLFLIVALCIKIEDHGPIFFKQVRTGKNGKEFRIYKFRSMVINNDMRDTSCEDQFTKVGKFIRRTSIDELAQLINILKGEMAFIGPRPWVPEYWENMTENERGRCSVLPGITGLAQVKGRNGITIFEKIAYDLEYVEKISLWEDLKIFFLTIKTTIKGNDIDAGKAGISDDLLTLKEGLRINDIEIPLQDLNKMKFSVLMSVYSKEKPEYLKESLKSVFSQTVMPDEVVLVEDGMLGAELEEVVRSYENSYGNFHVVRRMQNKGLGDALRAGLAECKNEIVFRMDTDDISERNRFEKQLTAFEKAGVDVVGSNIMEYDSEMNIKTGERNVPEKHNEIRQTIRSRNPINHMSVGFKKSKVIDAGNYLQMPGFEDYYLWARMMKDGAKFYNVQENLVMVRGGDELMKRRGGIKYAKSVRNFEKEMLKLGLIGHVMYLRNISIRTIACLLPSFVRKTVYKKALRK